MNENDYDFKEVVYQSKPLSQKQQKTNLFTFSDLLVAKHNIIKEHPKQNKQKKQNFKTQEYDSQSSKIQCNQVKVLLSSQYKNSKEVQFQNYQPPKTAKQEYTQSCKESKHLRGPSKIKDILSSLKTGVLNDLQKIADELFCENQIDENYDELQARISFSQVNLFNDEELHSFNKSLLSFKEEDVIVNIQDYPEILFFDQDQEDSVEIQESELSINDHSEFENKRRRRHLQRKHNQFLDIIQEQSFEQITPEKTRNNQSESDQDNNIGSVPCFRSRFENYSPLYLSQHNEVEKYYPPTADESINYGAPSQSQLIRETPFVVDDLNTIKVNNVYMSEEDAIMESWNNLCTKIIQKNLLPMKLNLDRIQNEQNQCQRSSIFQKLARAKRRIQMVKRLQTLNQYSTSSYYPSTIQSDEQQ